MPPLQWPTFTPPFSEADRARMMGADVSFKSRQSLQQMKKAIGATWLDEHLRDHDAALAPRGFQSDIQSARQARRVFLIEKGFEVEAGQRLSQDVLTRLEQADLNEVAKSYVKAQHLDYRAAEAGISWIRSWTRISVKRGY